MSKYEKVVLSLDEEIISQSRARWDYVAKPVGSLGKLETLYTKICAIQEQVYPDIAQRCVVVSCADNGVTKHGVAKTPSSVTVTMTDYISKALSAVGLMGKNANCDVVTVDCGMFSKLDSSLIIDRHIQDGTCDMTDGPAMTAQQGQYLIDSAIDLVRDLKQKDYKIIATGEMGIGNTTTSSAVTSVLLGVSPNITTGRGVGLTDEALSNKIQMISKAISVNQPDSNNAFDVLIKVGGFDIAHMVGIFIGGAIYRVPIIIDGAISSAAALIASRICPESIKSMIPSHLSPEPVCKMILNELNLSPVIDAGMRLGEGTGAVALLPLLDMADTVYKNLFTYGDLGF